ncbi:hypothetical protein QTP70_007229 [Hemibagrus guttatus]|uniref:Uncharacterized protein n=1 Tax=Hemibagrus guttatus TaxID=175788 RepID=A0AAE0Q0U3_9TELE|nr:hypothetical protein QTP70_007229 [Hemibagrus guttatus]
MGILIRRDEKERPVTGFSPNSEGLQHQRNEKVSTAVIYVCLDVIQTDEEALSTNILNTTHKKDQGAGLSEERKTAQSFSTTKMLCKVIRQRENPIELQQEAGRLVLGEERKRGDERWVATANHLSPPIPIFCILNTCTH